MDRCAASRSSVGAARARIAGGLAAIVSCLVLSSAVSAQGPADAGPPSSLLEQSARNGEPAFFVRADVDRPSREYREGDVLFVNARCELEAYLYLFYQQADGQLRVIFPNAAQRDNRIPAKQVVEVPAKDDLFRWVVGPPFGKEVIKVIATAEPLPRIDAAAGHERFSPIALREFQALGSQLKDGSPRQWAESEIEIMTYPRDQIREAPAGSRAKRFGVFFGVSDYRFNDEVQLATDGKHSINLVNGHNDALRLAEAFAAAGRLDDRKVYVNHEATRRQMEQAVTEWLPSVSRPGDTVFIHFTGHGVKIEDNNGDESDGKDEVLLPHDMVDLAVLVGLIKKVERGEKADPRLERWRQMARTLGTPEATNAALLRETGISDDLFGRWLQRLDGRHVVVILGSCYGGGFATAAKEADAEKKNDAADKDLSFGFLDGEISRLKDIGQKEQALLTSALSTQEARDFHAMGMSLMPYFLRAILMAADGPLTLEQGHEYCRLQMAKLYREINRKLREEGKETLKEHQPFLVNYCSDTVYLKP